MKHRIGNLTVEWVKSVKRYRIEYPNGRVLWTNSFKIIREVHEMNKQLKLL